MKNKYTIFVMFFFCFLSQLSYSQKSNKKIKSYNNYYFTFNYPKSWKQIKSEIDKDGTVVRVAPSSSIFNSDVIPKFNGGEFSFNEFNVLVKRNKFKNLNDYILDKNKKSLKTPSEKGIYIENSVDKINDFQYVENVEYAGEDIINQKKTTYYYLHKDDIYILTFSFESDKVKKYKKDKNLIINSFQFKN